MRRDECFHHRDAPLVLHDIHPHATRSQKRFLAHERLVLAYDNVRDAVEQNRAAAHRARRKRRIHDALAIHRRGLPAGTFESVHFAVEHRAALLDSAVVAAAENRAAMHEHGADGNTPFPKAGSGFLDGGSKKCIHVSTVIMRHAFRTTNRQGVIVMLQMAIVFLVVGLIATLLGFTTIAGASIAIAKFLAGLFLVLFLVFLVLGLAGARRLVR